MMFHWLRQRLRKRQAMSFETLTDELARGLALGPPGSGPFELRVTPSGEYWVVHRDHPLSAWMARDREEAEEIVRRWNLNEAP